MPRGDKRRYTDKQKRKAEHIEEGFKERGMSAKEAAARAWATVNAIHGGGEKRGGSGYGKPENHEPMRKGGRKGGKASGRKRASSAKRTRSKPAKTSRTSSASKRSTRARKPSRAKTSARGRRKTSSTRRKRASR